MRKKEGIREEGKRLEKKRGKEDKKYPTMPHVIFSYYRVRKTGRKGQAFSEHFLLILITFNKMACHLAAVAGQETPFFTTTMSARPS